MGEDQLDVFLVIFFAEEKVVVNYPSLTCSTLGVKQEGDPSPGIFGSPMNKSVNMVVTQLDENCSCLPKRVM